MSAIDLAIGAGCLLTVGWALFWLRRRRPRTRLARLSRRPGGPTALPGSAARGRGARFAERAATVLTERPAAALISLTSVVTGAVLLLAGPVAAVVTMLYTTMAVIGAHRRLVRQARDRAVTDLLDAIDAASGELRAGIVPGAALAPATTGTRPGRLSRRADVAVQVAVDRLEAAQRLSEALGVPLADLLDRVDADLRSGQALRAQVAAQTSAPQATAVMLLGLPLVGLWLGAALGADPLHQLLHTSLGAACAIVAVVLQCAGLIWTSRMIRAVVSEVR